MAIKTLISGLALVACTVGLSHAGSAPKAAAVVGDAAAGKSKTATCAACHGADGNSVVASFPKLAGQGEKYLIKQMHDVKENKRAIVEMTGMLDNFSDQDLADIAAFYASQKVTVGAADPDLVKLGEEIYRAGNSAKGLTACTACHSPTGQGNAPAGYPAVGGQHAGYIAKQLEQFRMGANYPDKGRKNDGDTRIMRDTAAKLNNREIEAVSSYISGLH